jgi:hypothetical protein
VTGIATDTVLDVTPLDVLGEEALAWMRDQLTDAR